MAKQRARVTKASGRSVKPAKSAKSAKPTRKAQPAPRSATGPFLLPYVHVDAFASPRFKGNPAGVVLLQDRWLPDEVMQSIADENKHAETAFVLPKAKAFGLRWFTPTIEVDLCGHATLAAAHVLWSHVKLDASVLRFSTRSGVLSVSRRENGLIELDFPALPGKAAKVTPELCAALGAEPVEVYKSAMDWMAVFDNRRAVYQLQPDMAKVAGLGLRGVIVTAPGTGHDFVSRFFAPSSGVPEDPVTGSAHCTLVPYWSWMLGKKELVAHQVSHRGGELWCTDAGTRVKIAGHAVTYLSGTITI